MANGFVFKEFVSDKNLVWQVTVIDHDEGSNGEITFSLRSSEAQGLFDINPRTGEISILRPLAPTDQNTEYILTVEATDHGEYRAAPLRLI